jgi:hypothetical protein
MLMTHKIWILAACGLAACPARAAWTFSQQGTVLQVHHVSALGSPQVFALHLDSSYYRLNTGPGCGWGTSVVLWPSYWSGGNLYQGGTVLRYIVTPQGPDLLIKLMGRVGTLNCKGSILLSPPSGPSIKASVTMNVSGNVLLDNRPNEAFKPVFLSSMHVGSRQWDSYNVVTDVGIGWFPSSGWALPSPHTSRKIQLTGGNSDWKLNAPTITVTLDEPRAVTGWVTPSTNPNDDNVGIWCATSFVDPSYTYEVKATSN